MLAIRLASPQHLQLGRVQYLSLGVAHVIALAVIVLLATGQAGTLASAQPSDPNGNSVVIGAAEQQPGSGADNATTVSPAAGLEDPYVASARVRLFASGRECDTGSSMHACTSRHTAPGKRPSVFRQRWISPLPPPQIHLRSAPRKPYPSRQSPHVLASLHIRCEAKAPATSVHYALLHHPLPTQSL